VIRFIDLGRQIGLDEEWSREFAFFDTITDTFITMDGEQVWDSWTEFKEAYAGTPWRTRTSWTLERFRSLCPAWVFEGNDEPT